ncbi:discoidin domain-containing protein [Catenuloplanes atrovinosus]|uniref:F5/8 type C domain-containing protein n=1 Tax=Catenuloplanes atrovinosus TaxID=137266 RepID=A0AAE3YL50_9ACTN|nr:discoidin domain-containing protein [Catenuloplanes atrovinosus]MDR7275480.1 hypothetical protein [Catenuloplanes atrovinosus]
MRHRPPRILSALTVAASAAATLVAVAPATPAVAAPSNDPTCNTAVNGTPAGPTGQSATNYVLNVGGASEFANIHTPAANTQAAFPYLVGADSVAADGTPIRRHTANFSLSPDEAGATPHAGQVTSVDGAQTFPASTYTEDVLATPAMTGAIRLRSGVLLGYSFKAQAGKASGTQATYTAFRSTDDGATWTARDAVFNLTSSANGTRVAGVPLELADGTILVTLYGTFTDGVNDRVQLQASTDGGNTFTRRAIIANGNATNGYNETGIAQLPSGKLIAVMRHHVPQSDGTVRGLGTPAWTTSTDNGTTWAALQPLSVSFPYGYDPINDSTGALTAVQPDLKLMPNGVLVLRSGRPDNWVAISSNGEGTGWIGQLTYRNCPSDGNRVHGSTGYGGIDYVSANRAVVIGDNCEKTWSCVTAAETDFTVDKRTHVWRRWFDVLTPDVGRIDLATKYRQGRITVSTDLSDSIEGHPRARVDGAFDGSTEYWSSAVKADGAGTYTINLDRRYPLTKIGLSLRNGRSASARVFVSPDFTTWTQVAAPTNRTHLAMEYFTVPAGTEARFVRVELDATAGCDAGLGSTCAFLNEIELYSAINSFENDPVNNRPRGFTDMVLSWQTQRSTDLAGNSSASALRIIDQDANQHAKVVWNGAATGTKRLEFRIKPISLVGQLFDVLGRTSAGTSVSAHHFAVQQDGSLARYTGTAWVTVTAPGVIPVGAWSTIVVTANVNTASLEVNGEPVATGLPRTTATTTLTGYSFASAGTAPVGDNFLIDDVLFTS